MDNGLHRYNHFLSQVKTTPKRILVIGDKINDTYIHCTLTRIAPEGGAPVMEIESSFTVPGGAANVCEQLRAWNVMPCGIYPLKAEHQKTRYLVNDQLHMVVSRNHKPHALQSDEVLEWLTSGVHAVLVADYGKGAIPIDLARAISQQCKAMGIPLIVDPSPQPFADFDMRWEHATVIKVNRKQWWRRCQGGLPREWMDARRIDALVITNGPAAPDVYDSHQPGAPYGAPDRKLYLPMVDASGAGDHFAAVLAVGIAHGLHVHEATEFAHEASKLRVAYRRPRPVLPEEVRGLFDRPMGKILSAEDIRKVLLHEANRNIVFTNGVYSLLHAGHSTLFDFAKHQGDILVVGVNSDASARMVKGDGALMPCEQRCRLVASQQAVDFVCVFDEATPEALMKQLPPIACLVKGEDHRGEDIPGSQLAARVLFAPEVHGEHCTDWVSRVRERA